MTTYRAPRPISTLSTHIHHLPSSSRAGGHGPYFRSLNHLQPSGHLKKLFAQKRIAGVPTYVTILSFIAKANDLNWAQIHILHCPSIGQSLCLSIGPSMILKWTSVKMLIREAVIAILCVSEWEKGGGGLNAPAHPSGIIL